MDMHHSTDGYMIQEHSSELAHSRMKDRKSLTWFLSYTENYQLPLSQEMIGNGMFHWSIQPTRMIYWRTRTIWHSHSRIDLNYKSIVLDFGSNLQSYYQKWRMKIEQLSDWQQMMDQSKEMRNIWETEHYLH